MMNPEYPGDLVGLGDKMVEDMQNLASLLHKMAGDEEDNEEEDNDRDINGMKAYMRRRMNDHE